MLTTYSLRSTLARFNAIIWILQLVSTAVHGGTVHGKPKKPLLSSKKNVVDSEDLPWKISRFPAAKQISACVFQMLHFYAMSWLLAPTTWRNNLENRNIARKISITHFHVVPCIIVNNILCCPWRLHILCDQLSHASMQSFEFFNLFQRRCSAALCMAYQRNQCVLPKKNAVDSENLHWNNSRFPAVNQLSTCVFQMMHFYAMSWYIARKMGITHFHVVSFIIVNNMLCCPCWLHVVCDQPLHASMQSFEFLNLFQRRCSAALCMANKKNQWVLQKKNVVDSEGLPGHISRFPAVKQLVGYVFQTLHFYAMSRLLAPTT